MMRRVVLILLCVAALAAAKTPRPLANITLAAPPGLKATKLSAYPGKVMVIAIFSTQCRSCIDAIRYLERLQKDYQSKGVQMVGAAADAGAISTIRPFRDRHKITIPLGVLTEDEARRLSDSGPKDHLKVPAFLFVDKKGVVRFQHPGDDKFFDNVDKNTRSVIENLLRQ